MPGTIRVGCKVSGLIGPKLPLTGAQKRRTRQRFFGTVLRSCENQKWTVYWHEIDRCADHSFNSLKYETSTGMNLSGVNVDSILNTKYLGAGDNKVIDTFLSTWQPPATPLPPAPTGQAAPQTQPSVVETAESTTTEPTIDLQPITMHQPTPSQDSNSTNLSNFLTDPDSDPSINNTPTPKLDPTTTNTQQSVETNQGTSSTDNQEPEQEEVFDPQSIVRDILEDDRTGTNLRLREQYEQEKENLVGTVVNTSAGLSWKVRRDILQSEVVEQQDSLVGVKNFDFNNKRMKTGRGLVRINLLDLMIHLWPGDWRTQLTILNHRIHNDYKEKVRVTRHGRVKKVHEITEREFWIFLHVDISITSERSVALFFLKEQVTRKLDVAMKPSGRTIMGTR